MTIQFKRAERAQVKLKVALAGPSGSGKTDGALSLARQLVGPEGKIALLDTENQSASLYADRHEFDTVTMSSPFTSERYMEVIDAAAAAGYDALVIDSISHQWEGEGGILDRKEQLDRKGGNGFANWARFTTEHNRFREKMLQAPMHIIATLRSKVEYVQEEDSRGKKTVRKVGMKPITREGMDYEFSLVFDLTLDHRAYAAKDRTGLFGDPDAAHNLRDPKVGKLITDWLQSGKALVDVAHVPGDRATAAAAASTTSAASAPAELVFPETKRFPQLAGKPLREIATADLEAALPLFRQHSVKWAERIADILEDRRLNEEEQFGDGEAAPEGNGQAATTTDAASPSTSATEPPASGSSSSPADGTSTPTTSTRRSSRGSSAASASADSAPSNGTATTPTGTAREAATKEMTLEQAKALPFPFQKGKPQHGRPLDSFDNDFLQSIATWIGEKQEENGNRAFHADTLEAVALILADREKDQGKLPLDDAPPAKAESAGKPAALAKDDFGPVEMREPVPARGGGWNSPNTPADFDEF